jgi:hypothetical protein
MKKFIAPAAFSILLLATISPASAATWTAAVDADIASGHFDAINQIVAANPGDAGAIAAFLLTTAQNDAGSNPGKAVALLNVATPLAGQIPPADAPGAVGSIQTLLKLANDPGFQKDDTKGAAAIFSDALNLSTLPNITKADPKLHGIVVTDAGNFLSSHPGDKQLHDDVNLAQGNDLNGSDPDLHITRLKEQHAPSGE